MNVLPVFTTVIHIVLAITMMDRLVAHVIQDTVAMEFLVLVSRYLGMH